MFTPYIEKIIDRDAYRFFLRVKEKIKNIPEVNLPSGKNLSCHIVCRLLSKLTGLKFRDGYFGTMCDHSWLVCGRYIIDPYPIGMLDVPVIFETEYMLPWGKLYKEEKLKAVNTKEFKKDLKFCMDKILRVE